MRFILNITLISFVTTVIAIPVMAQKASSVKTTIRGDAQLTRPLGNKAFNKAFSGIFNGEASINFGNKNLSGGVLYRFTQYQVFPKVNTDAHPVLSIHTAGLRISYDRLTETGKGMWSPFIEPGYSFLKYTKVLCINHTATETKTTALSLNLGATYYIMMDEWTGVGFTVGYNMVDYVYHPESICMDEWGTYTPNDKKGSLHGLFFGFSVYFDLAFKPETSE